MKLTLNLWKHTEKRQFSQLHPSLPNTFINTEIIVTWMLIKSYTLKISTETSFELSQSPKINKHHFTPYDWMLPWNFIQNYSLKIPEIGINKIVFFIKKSFGSFNFKFSNLSKYSRIPWQWEETNGKKLKWRNFSGIDRNEV